jgi:hypothetical protein
MSTTEMTKRTAEAWPPFKARIAGFFYLLVFLTGGLALFLRGGWGSVAGLVAGVCYVVVTLLFYEIFRPVNSNLSLLAAVISLVGIIFGPLSFFYPVLSKLNPLVFFGFYCLLIGYLIFRSSFLPRILGVLMAFGGLGWLIFLSPALANYLSPYNFIPGLLGEGVLTLWLILMGVNVQRWKEQADANSPKSKVRGPSLETR